MLKMPKRDAVDAELTAIAQLGGACCASCAAGLTCESVARGRGRRVGRVKSRAGKAGR